MPRFSTSQFKKMHPFDEAFVLLHPQRVTICRSCHHAVFPGSVGAHVNIRHRYLPTQERQQIVERALKLEKEGVLSPDIDGIRFPGREDPAVADLPVWADGKRCLLTRPDGRPCGHIRRTRHGIQTHCRDVHGWVNGRPYA